MSRAQDNTDSIDESIEITQESKDGNWMSSYLYGDIEFAGGNGAVRRTEQGKATEKKDSDVQVMPKAKEGEDVVIPEGMDDIEDIFMAWKGDQVIYLINKLRAERKLLKEKRRGYDDTFDSVIDESYFTVGRKE